MQQYRLGLLALVAWVLLSSLAAADSSPTERRALLASPGFEGQPIKGVYFFPGESAGNLDKYTIHPIVPDDQHWNSVPSSRTRVLDRIIAAGANTIVMSYWSNMPQWSPMFLDVSSDGNCKSPSNLPEPDAYLYRPSNCEARLLLDAVQDRHLLVWPAIEGGVDPKKPDTPHWQFSTDFPAPFSQSFSYAPGLVTRIGQLVDIFSGHMNLWAQLYDQTGTPRYVVQVIHACSALAIDDHQFADAFDKVAAQILHDHRISVGFVLDFIGNSGECTYVAAPGTAGPILAQKPSVLAVNGFESEVFSGKVKSGDNNQDNLESLADWKRAAVNDWVASGLPLILDVSSGMDGRIIWAGNGLGFWGDNMDYIDDRWRNWLSELKGTNIKGITFDTWNGYTEGYAAAPTREYGETVFHWLTDLFQADPRDCSHMHYVNGAPTWRVYGAICEKWMQLGADRGFSAPVSEELPTDHGRMSHFADGKTIYWGPGTIGAHEVHGIIEKTYRENNTDSSCLGLPTSDEDSTRAGAVSLFEHGTITFNQGDVLGHVNCR
jgi:LGFP repeat